MPLVVFGEEGTAGEKSREGMMPWLGPAKSWLAFNKANPLLTNNYFQKTFGSILSGLTGSNL